MNIKDLSDRMICAYAVDSIEGRFVGFFENVHPSAEIVKTGDFGERDLSMSLMYNNKIKLTVNANYYSLTCDLVKKCAETLYENYFKLMETMTELGNVWVK